MVMASLPFSDGVLELARSGGPNRMRALLKAATELYVSEVHHGRTEAAMYEELALQLIRTTPVEDRRAVALMLVHQDDAPAAVLRALLADDVAVAEPLIAECAALTDADLLGVIANGSDDHLAAVAARPRLSPAVVEALVRNLPDRHLPVLLANASAEIPQPLLPLVLDRARGRPAIARAVARRERDVEDTDLVDLFLDLDDRGRRRVIQAMEILALREFAAKRPLPRTPVPDPAKVQDLARAALSRNQGLVADGLAALVGLDHATARRLVDDPGGEPLALALRAAGIDGPTAVRIILFSGGQDVRDYFEVKRLVELYETVSLRSAMALVGRWRTEAERDAIRPRHVPQTEAGTPVRTHAPTARPQPGFAELPGLRRERG